MTYLIDGQTTTATKVHVAPRPYDKHDASPHTKAHVALLLGAASETCALLRELYIQTRSRELRREFSRMLDEEHEQLLQLALLTPGNEDATERAVAHEQLAIKLTSTLAERENNKKVKAAFEHTLADDVDHLYRFSNLLDITEGASAQTLVSGLTEIMPGRHTATQPRAAQELAERNCAFASDIQTQLAVMIAATVKRHTADFYTTASTLAKDRLSRALFSEIARIELLHATVFDGFMPPRKNASERILLQKTCQCYLLFSCRASETDARIRAVFDDYLAESISRFKRAATLAERYGNKDCEKIVADDGMPPPLILRENVAYVRSVLDKYLSSAPREQVFSNSPSRKVVVEHIRRCGRDYRFETAPHPVQRLRDTTADNA